MDRPPLFLPLKHNRVFPACLRVLQVTSFKYLEDFRFYLIHLINIIKSSLWHLTGSSTNPFFAPVASQAAPTNPFQTNGRAAGVGVAAAGEGRGLQNQTNAHLHRDPFSNSAKAVLVLGLIIYLTHRFVKSFKWVRYPRYPR